MMRIGYVLGLSLQTELLILAFFGIMCTIFDASLLEFNSNLLKIWALKMDPSVITETAEYYVKYALSGIVVVRTFTVHIYLGCYIVMLYPLIFEDRPRLILPWMVINFIKCLMTGAASLLVGCYTCLMYKFLQPTCWEFLLTHFLDDAPSIYMFCLVLTFYRELTKLMKVSKYIDPVELKARRRRARLLTESKAALEYKDAFSRSLDGLIAKMKENDEEGVKPPVDKHASAGPLTAEAYGFPTMDSCKDRKVETVVTRDTATSGRNIEATTHDEPQPEKPAPEKPAPEKPTPEKPTSEKPTSGKPASEKPASTPVLDTDVIEEEEEKVERVSDLEAVPTPALDLDTTPPVPAARPETVEEATVTDEFGLVSEEYRTVSELLNDPNIAIVLNMIAEDDEEWEVPEEVLAATYGVDEPLTLHDDHWLDVRPSSEALGDTRPKRRDAALQVNAPTLDSAINELAQLRRSTSTTSSRRHRIYDMYEQPQKDVAAARAKPAIKRKSTLTEPARVKAATSSLPPPPHRAEGAASGARSPPAPAAGPHGHSPAEQPLNQIYRNRAAFPKTYRDDGYTQAFYENLQRNRMLHQQQVYGAATAREM